MPGIMGTVLIYGGLLAVMWFFLIRPQKKKQDQIKQMRSSLGVGDEVVTIGGIVGKIKSIKEDFIHLEVIKGSNNLVVTKWAIGEVLKSKAKKAEKIVEPEEVVEEASEEVASENVEIIEDVSTDK